MNRNGKMVNTVRSLGLIGVLMVYRNLHQYYMSIMQTRKPVVKNSKTLWTYMYGETIFMRPKQ